jgi:hypothetical protein
MKEKFKQMNTKGKMVSCQGNKHIIRLSSGEEIEVFTHRQRARRKDGRLTGAYWCVSDVQSGMQILGFYERFDIFDTFYQNDEESVLEYARHKIELFIHEQKCTFAEMRKKRIEKVKVELLTVEELEE